MKTIYTLLFTVLLTGIISCTDNDPDISTILDEQEVELTILTFSQSTRASVPDPGVAKERQIDELDLLIFKDNKYQYSRAAFKIATNKYKANLKVDNASLTAHVFANCRTQLTTWEGATNQQDKTWETIQAELIDLNPGRLVSNNGEILPMWGTTSGTVSETQVSGWGTVTMLRSVASVDAYIEQNAETDKFILTDAHLYYAPDRGYYAPEPNGSSYELTSPADMQTLLDTLRASRTTIVSIEDGGGTITKQAIANQLYLYDNDINSSNFSPNTPPIRKYTRLILAGYYDQPLPDPDPITGEDRRSKTYYPLDFVAEDGHFHDIKRNYKYVFNITSVHGPGYGSLEKAADEYPINMNVEVIPWNQEDEYIGVQGKYYVSLERRYACLSRNAGSTDSLTVTYRIYDDIPATQFSLAFADDTNGTERTVEKGIENDYFRVLLEHDVDGNKAGIKVIALQEYTEANSTDTVTLCFRNLTFEITIKQVDSDGSDWEWGGNQDENLE